MTVRDNLNVEMMFGFEVACMTLILYNLLLSFIFHPRQHRKCTVQCLAPSTDIFSEYLPYTYESHYRATCVILDDVCG